MTSFSCPSVWVAMAFYFVSLLFGHQRRRTGFREWVTIQWHQNERHHDVSNHRQLYASFNRLFRLTSKNTSNYARAIGPFWPVTDGFPHKGPVARKVFPWHDITMKSLSLPDHQRLFVSGYHSKSRPMIIYPVLSQCINQIVVGLESLSRIIQALC